MPNKKSADLLHITRWNRIKPILTQHGPQLQTELRLLYNEIYPADELNMRKLKNSLQKITELIPNELVEGTGKHSSNKRYVLLPGMENKISGFIPSAEYQAKIEKTTKQNKQAQNVAQTNDERKQLIYDKIRNGKSIYSLETIRKLPLNIKGTNNLISFLNSLNGFKVQKDSFNRLFLTLDTYTFNDPEILVRERLQTATKGILSLDDCNRIGLKLGEKALIAYLDSLNGLKMQKDLRGRWYLTSNSYIFDDPVSLVKQALLESKEDIISVAKLINIGLGFGEGNNLINFLNSIDGYKVQSNHRNVLFFTLEDYIFPDPKAIILSALQKSEDNILSFKKIKELNLGYGEGRNLINFLNSLKGYKVQNLPFSNFRYLTPVNYKFKDSELILRAILEENGILSLNKVISLGLGMGRGERLFEFLNTFRRYKNKS